MGSLHHPAAGREDERKIAAELRKQRARILGVLADLWQARDEIDLDTIDAEFYYRCCLPGCEELLDRARAIDPADGFAPLSAVEDLFGDYQIPRPIGHAFVFYGHRLRIRHVQARIVCDERHLPRIQPASVKLDVFSGAWKGRDVAAYMEELRARATLLGSPTPPDSVRVEFRFHAEDDEAKPFTYLVGDGPQATLVTSKRRRAPHVEVIVSVPMPAAGVIADAYDGMRKHLGWHKKLAQASRQEVVTALRTWTIVLLRQSGDTFSQAVGTWWEHSEFPQDDDEGLSESKYYRDIDRLYARVPEAKPFLAR